MSRSGIVLLRAAWVSVRASLARAGLASLLFISVASCITGRDRPQGADVGAHDGSASRDGEAERHEDQGKSDVLRLDQGPLPPSDFPCEGDPWIKTPKTDIRCASRYVLTVESGISVVPQVAIAVDGIRKVGIAYGDTRAAEEGQLHLVSFPAGSRQLPNPTVLAGHQFERFGVRVAMVPRSIGGFHLAYLVMDAQGRKLNYSGWTGSGLPAPEFLSAEVGSKGSVDLVEAADGRVFVFYYAEAAHMVYVRIRPKGGGGVWSPAQELDSDVEPSVVGAGQLAVVRHAGGGPAFALHFALGQNSSPRFRRYDGNSGWSSKKTLDNKTHAGIAGQSIDLVITQTEHYATYFAIPTGSVAAQLRLVTWASANDTPKISILEQAIPVKAGDPRYEAALAVDSWGLLHLAVILPSPKTSPGTSLGVLEYRRQVLNGGQKTWITDVVDDDVASVETASHVALWVEPRGHPHIVYFNGRTKKLMYATRDDR